MLERIPVGELSLLVALVASLPYLLKLLLYYAWKPDLAVEYVGVVRNRNRSKRLLSVRTEYRLDPIAHERTVSELLANDAGRPLFESETVVVEGGEYRIAPGTTRGIPLPLESEASAQIRLYPRVHLSEFGFPRFYGDVELRPLEYAVSPTESEPVTRESA